MRLEEFCQRILRARLCGRYGGDEDDYINYTTNIILDTDNIKTDYNNLLNDLVNNYKKIIIK